jgi:4-hydroxybenzoate polyprenyltransferase
VVAAPVSSFRNFVEEFLWLWLHLLQFTTANQSCSVTAVAEDADNKPDRPIPSGRMSLGQVRILRCILVPICLAVSYQFSTSVLAASVAVIAITIWYNDFGGGGNHWFIRNLLNGLGFGAFNAGAILLAGASGLSWQWIPFQPQVIGHDRLEFDIVGARAILLSIGIYATTTHTQDFKDVEGDIKINRSTVPLAYPRIARPSVLFGLMAWSVFLSYIWELNVTTTIPMCALAAFVGVRFCIKEGRENDQISFYWYNVSS